MSRSARGGFGRELSPADLDSIADLAGLHRRSPLLALTLIIGGFHTGTFTAGEACPRSSMCVRKSCVYGVFCFEENTSHLLLEDQLCQESAANGTLHSSGRAGPLRSPGMIQMSLEALMSES